jgi:hypothetical protein
VANAISKPAETFRAARAPNPIVALRYEYR